MKNAISFAGFKKFWSEHAKGDKGRRLILIAGGIGIALIFLSSIWPAIPAAGGKTETEEFSTAAYTAALEERMTGIVANIEGAGQAEVLITLENGVEYIYANEERKNTDKSEDLSGDDTTRTQQRNDVEQKVIVVQKPEGGTEALVRTAIEPRVKGVVIVCAGGDHPLVQQRIIDAVTTALDIASSRVCVTKLT